METLTRQIVDWHVESAPFEGGPESGDRGAVHVDGNNVFGFVIDALGHGSEAARMAELTERQLRFEPDLSLVSIIEDCHRQLQGTRGSALCLLAIDAGSDQLRWLSVGNIQAVRVQLDSHGMPQFESLVLRAGVVGDRLPELRTSHAVLKPGDILVIATDGIGYGWYGEYRPNITPAALGRAIRERHCHGNDDAFVLVIRYLGQHEGTPS